MNKRPAEQRAETPIPSQVSGPAPSAPSSGPESTEGKASVGEAPLLSLSGPEDLSWHSGKHWHQALGWTDHGEAACRAAVRESAILADLRAILARRRAKASK